MQTVRTGFLLLVVFQYFLLGPSGYVSTCLLVSNDGELERSNAHNPSPAIHNISLHPS
jgi:hypothetical protein